MAPIGKPPVAGGMDRANSFKRNNFDSSDHNTLHPIPRHKRGGSMSTVLMEGGSQGGISTDRLNHTGPIGSNRPNGMIGGSYPSGLLPTLGLTKYKNVDL